MPVKKIEVFVTSDGRHFDCLEDAARWEARCEIVTFIRDNNEIYWREADPEVVVDELLKKYNIAPKENEE